MAVEWNALRFVKEGNRTLLMVDVSRDQIRDAPEYKPNEPSAVLTTKNAEIEKLHALIKQLQRRQFGRSSEQLAPDQLQLGLEDLEQAVAAVAAVIG